MRGLGALLLLASIPFACAPSVSAEEPLPERPIIFLLPEAPLPHAQANEVEAEAASARAFSLAVPAALQNSLVSSSVPSAPNVDSDAIRPVEHPLTREQISSGCASGELRGKTCKVSWLPILWQSFEWLTAQHSGNILLDSETRHDLTTNPYWSTYVQDVKNYRWNQWSDDTTFIVHDIGHPMMGGITSSIYEQNDPKGRALVYENSSVYWHSRLKAMAWSAVYSAQWKVGPVSEASIGNSGKNTYYVPDLHRTTNETGFQDFIITPIYGMGWNVGEDVIDRYLMPKIRARVHSKLGLTALFWMTPCKSAANVLRFKPMYYRDEMSPLPR